MGDILSAVQNSSCSSQSFIPIVFSQVSTTGYISCPKLHETALRDLLTGVTICDGSKLLSEVNYFLADTRISPMEVGGLLKPWAQREH